MIPEGMRDILPPETGQRRAVEAILRRRFDAYGYGEVITPWLEFAETLEVAGDDTLAAGYRLWDEQGRQLMVRTDMTAPVARVAADRYSDEPLPLRFSYIASAIRPWAPQRGQDGEFVQAGAELLGLHAASADAEAVTLLCDTLASLGLRDYRVTLGTVAFHRALVDSLGLADSDRAKLLEALADRDYPLLESIAGKSALGDSARKALQRMLELSGTRDSLAQARKLATSPRMEAAIEKLVSVHDLVEEAGYGEVLTFDFGLFQDLSLLQRPCVRGVRARRRAAHRLGRALRRAARPLRLGHPRGGLRHRPRPSGAGVGRGRRPACGRAGPTGLRRRSRTARARRRTATHGLVCGGAAGRG